MGKIPRLIMDSGQSSTKPIVNIVTTIGADIAELKINLRPEDANEILRFGISIQKALWQSYKHAAVCKTAFIDGKIAAVWGVAGTIIGNRGIPFLMTTPEVHKISPLRFTRLYQQEVIKMTKLFPKLENYVDAEYASAIRMLEIIGFRVDKPERIGTGMFCKFRMGA